MYHAFGERLSRGGYHKEKKMKLITALDLQRWADTKESEGLMPELIRRLIHSSLNDIMRLSMPSGDSRPTGIRGRFFDPFLIKGLKYPVRNKSH